MPINKLLSLVAFWCAFQLSYHPAGAQVIRAQDGAFASSSVSCFIVSPIGITKVQDMNFGAIVSGNSGTVILSPEDGNLLTTGNVSLRSAQGTVSAAIFEVNDGTGTGASQRNFTSYSITLPTSDITLLSESGSTMRVSNFTSSPSSSGVGTFTNGKGVLTVGATLYVNSSQGIGRYMSTVAFPVTVNFD